MFALDLFNTPYERALTEGAVDNLEARYIHGLNMKMLDLLDRAHNASPEMKEALKREFQKVKAERNEFFKINPKTGMTDDGMLGTTKGKLDELGYSGLTHESSGSVPMQEGSMKRWLESQAERMSKERFVSNAAEYGMGDEEAAEFWDNINGVKEAGIPGNVPADKIPGKEDLLKGKGRKYYETAQKKNSEKPLDQALQRLKVKARREYPRAHTDDEALALKILNKEQDDVARLNRENEREDIMISRLVDLEQNLQSQIDQLKAELPLDEHGGGIGPKQHWQSMMEAPKLHVGDPIIVTAPNEFEGKTGEVAEFSPSGKFVIVNLYNHGEHSMHLSDVKYNDYADQEEADDWYDEMDEQDVPVEEGFQDFNKVEPYAVCLAGKPVKKFDYYEEARRFHDNWKKKLYREGNKEKADKITLMPLNLDEAEMTPDEIRGRVEKNIPHMMKNMIRDYSTMDDSSFKQAHGLTRQQFYQQLSPEARNHYMKEAAKPAQQAAIAIAMKKAGKKPKSVDEASKYGSRPQDMLNYDNDELRVLRKFVVKKLLPSGVRGSKKTAIRAEYLINSLRTNMGLLDPKFNSREMYKSHIEATERDVRRVRKELHQLLAPYGFQAVEEGVAEVATDYQKRRQHERNVDAGKPVTKQRQPRMTDYQKRRAQDRKDMELGEEYGAGETVPTVDAQQWQQAYQKAVQAVKMAKTQQEYETASERANKIKELLASKGVTVGPALGEMDKSQTPPARHGDYPLGIKNKDVNMVKPTTPKKVVKDLAKDLDNAFDLDSAFDKVKEEKTRLDPKCWTGKKIGNPKTKVKGGVRVNNCVPAESVNENQDTSAVESAIIRRIMVAHTDLLMKFGPEKVMQAAEEVAYNVGDVDEIGTSDVSAYVDQVKQILGVVR